MLLLSTRGGLKARWGNHRLKWRYSQPILPLHISHLHHHSSSSTTTKTHTEKPKLKKIGIKTEDEIKVIIEDEVACLHQENERLRLVLEHMADERCS
jgi:hypothetical protein